MAARKRWTATLATSRLTYVRLNSVATYTHATASYLPAVTAVCLGASLMHERHARS
jgi:hypothetical protein